MERQNLTFKQLFYTHAQSGVYGKSKGWQLVGVSDRNYFQPLLHRYFSVLSIPEAMRLPKNFTLYSMQVVNDVPVLIRIVDAGLTVESRPGNIFAHALVLEEASREAFYKCDALSLLTEWEGWQNHLEGPPNANLAPLSLDLPEFADGEVIESARSYLENTAGISESDLLNRIVCAGSLALNARSPQYLIIHPANGRHPDLGVNLFRVIWSWAPIALRKRASFWIGRNSLKMPGFNWLILGDSDRKMLNPQTLGRSAFGFDLRHNGFTQENILNAKSDQEVSTMDITAETIQERNQRSDVLENFFGYEGTNGKKISGLMSAYKRYKEDLNSENFCAEVQNILSEFDRKDQPDEYIYVFNSLIWLTGTLTANSGKITTEFIDTAFKIDYSGSKLQKLLQILLPRVKTLLLNSLDWEISKTGESYQSFLTKVFEQLTWFKAPESKCSPQALWADIIQDAETSPSAWQLLKLLLNWHIESDANVLKGLQSTTYRSKVDWLNSKDFGMLEAGSEQAEKQWYKKLFRMLTTATRQEIIPVGQTDGLIIELYGSRPEAAGDFTGKLLISYIAKYKMSSNEQVRCWTRLYESTDNTGRDVIRQYYFDCIKEVGPVQQEISKSNSLLPYFDPQNDRELIWQEILCRLSKYTILIQPKYAPEGHFKEKPIPLTTSELKTLSNYFTGLLEYASHPNNGIHDLANMLKSIIADKTNIRIGLIVAGCNHLIETNKKAEMASGSGVDLDKMLSYFEEYRFCFESFANLPPLDAQNQSIISQFKKQTLSAFLLHILKNPELPLEKQQILQKWVKLLKLGGILDHYEKRVKRRINEGSLTFKEITLMAAIISPLNTDASNAPEDFFNPLWRETILNSHTSYPGLKLFNWYFEKKRPEEDSPNIVNFHFIIRLLYADSATFKEIVENLFTSIPYPVEQAQLDAYNDKAKFVTDALVNKCLDLKDWEPVDLLYEKLFAHLKTALNTSSEGNESQALKNVSQAIKELRNHPKITVQDWKDRIDLRILTIANEIAQKGYITPTYNFLKNFFPSVRSIGIDSNLSEKLEDIQEYILKQVIAKHRETEYHIKLIKISKFFNLLDFFRFNTSRANKLFPPKAIYNFEILLSIFYNAARPYLDSTDSEIVRIFDASKQASKIIKKLQQNHQTDHYTTGGWRKFIEEGERKYYHFINCYFRHTSQIDYKTDDYTILETIVRGKTNGFGEKLAKAILRYQPESAEQDFNQDPDNTNEINPTAYLSVQTELRLVKHLIHLFYYIHPINEKPKREKVFGSFILALVKLIEKNDSFNIHELLESNSLSFHKYSSVSKAIFEIAKREYSQTIQFQGMPSEIEHLICIDLLVNERALCKRYVGKDEKRINALKKLLSRKKSKIDLYRIAEENFNELLRKRNMI